MYTTAFPPLRSGAVEGMRGRGALGVPTLLCITPLLVCSASDDVDRVVKKFTAKQRRKAVKAYKLVHGDGLGIDGEPAPTQESFVEGYITLALEQEAKRIRREKGVEDEGEDEPESLDDVKKQHAPETLDGQIEQMLVQKKQKRAVRERARQGKPREMLASAASPELNLSWTVACGESLFRRHVYDTVAGCSPGPKPGLPCVRLVFDDVATPQEQEDMLTMMDEGLEGLFHRGSETLLVPEEASRPRMGEEGWELTGRLLGRMRQAIAGALGIHESVLYYSGSLVKRLDYPPLSDSMQLDARYDSFNAHVDKANIASYDWSALLYFSHWGGDFGGGELIFHDQDADRVVPPLAGRLVAFSSGLENLHRVAPMTWGSRYVLAMWFTCSEKHRHKSIGLSGGSGRGAPAAKAAGAAPESGAGVTGPLSSRSQEL